MGGGDGDGVRAGLASTPSPQPSHCVAQPLACRQQCAQLCPTLLTTASWQAIANLMDEFKAKNRVGKVRQAGCMFGMVKLLTHGVDVCPGKPAIYVSVCVAALLIHLRCAVPAVCCRAGAA